MIIISKLRLMFWILILKTIDDFDIKMMDNIVEEVFDQNQFFLDIKKNECNLIAYTDGACSGNPGPGGWGVVFVGGEQKFCVSGNNNHTTNNRMELIAAIQAIEISKKYVSQMSIVTDSTYIKNGITLWIKSWIANNWRTSSKTEVKNKDLWIHLYDLCKNINVNWSWVKGHSGNKFNDDADFLATQAIVGVFMNNE